ncbi:MAG: fluoride efflux transporter FluC [Bacteroidota bacterium]|jgi:CrcB protein
MQWLYTVLIFTGGGIGALLRGFMAQNLVISSNSTFTQTLIINSVGSFIIGFLWELPLSMEWKYFLIVGLLGGFTTFSGFSIEFLQFLQNKTWGLGFIYVISSVVLSLLLVWLGNRLYSLFV